MEARAKARFVRISPRKARRVVDLIRGRPVGEARRVLQFSSLGAARPVRKVLDSAVANAEQTPGVVPDNLFVARAFVDEFRLRYPSVADPSGSLAYDYELMGFLRTFIIDPAGTIRYRFVGYLDEDVLVKALNDVLSRAP